MHCTGSVRRLAACALCWAWAAAAAAPQAEPPQPGPQGVGTAPPRGPRREIAPETPRAPPRAGKGGGTPTGGAREAGSRGAPESPAGRPQAEEPPKPQEAETSSALDEALRELGIEPETAEEQPAPQAPAQSLWAARAGAATLQLLDLSADLLFAVGSSSERGEALINLQGGDHDPRKRGFTLQNLELSLLGAVDPYFDLESHLIFFVEPEGGETRFELEEAFLTSRALPLELEKAGLQIEAGFFFTEFGRTNPRHPHAWNWLDQPVVLTRFFGADGLRGAGARIGWLLPKVFEEFPWFSEFHLGVQNASGETMTSFLSSEEAFEERPIGGRPFVERDVRSIEDLLYLVRWDHGWDFSPEVSSKLGISLLSGPNATGPDGTTLIYGLDYTLKWRPAESERGWPFLIWESEIARREYRADNATVPDPDDPGSTLSLPGRTLEDWGFYTQVLYGFARNWGAGVRLEYASGSGASAGGRKADPFRDDRWRVSPLLLWQPTEFSRIRLQYNYDHADHISGRDAHSVWLGFEVLIGSHPAHTY